jgi:hypothetical protein
MWSAFSEIGETLPRTPSPGLPPAKSRALAWRYEDYVSSSSGSAHHLSLTRTDQNQNRLSPWPDRQGESLENDTELWFMPQREANYQ